jgi:hypothetical protein
MEIAMLTALRSILVCTPLLCLSGCSWLPYLGYNLVGTPLEVAECCCFHVETYCRGANAWREVTEHNPERTYSPAYHDGFCHGFADYVKRGGTGEPPAVPPCKYRYPVLRTPEQQQEIDDWFAGFRHGADVARQQGWREGVLVPISRPPLTVPDQFRQEIVPMRPPLDGPLAPRPLFEELPPPREPPVIAPMVSPLPQEAPVWLEPALPLIEADRIEARRPA